MEILQYDFIQNAIIAGVLISIAAGIIGSLVVVNKITFLTGGIAHSAYGGIGLAVYLGIPILFGATIFAIITAILIAIITLKNKSRIDAIIGMMWASGMAIGIVFIDITPGYNVDLMSYLFGSIIAVSSEDLICMSLLDIFIVIIVVFFYTLILILASLCVVAAIKAVGLILVIALLTIPTYLAETFANKLSNMMIISSILATMFTLCGLVISYLYDISSGASIIMVSVVALATIKILKK